MIVNLSNEKFEVKINLLGAELASVIGKETNTEYIWQADPTYWKRHSPVLFPIVGSLWENKYQLNGNEYAMTQHGFARDMNFTLKSAKENEAWFQLTQTEETLQKYPYPFVLEIGYRLEGNRIHVLWKVKNPSSDTIFFQIGAHPAFNYPDFQVGDANHGFFTFNGNEELYTRLIAEKGCVSAESQPIALEGKLLPLNNHTFDQDALVLENNQVQEVSLLTKDKTPYLSVSFKAPVVGLWSPVGKDAPFVCIEPWYGRCDRTNYQGDYNEKDWINRLEGNKEFEASYTIRIDNEE